MGAPLGLLQLRGTFCPWSRESRQHCTSIPKDATSMRLQTRSVAGSLFPRPDCTGTPAVCGQFGHLSSGPKERSSRSSMNGGDPFQNRSRLCCRFAGECFRTIPDERNQGGLAPAPSRIPVFGSIPRVVGRAARRSQCSGTPFGTLAVVFAAFILPPCILPP